MAMTGNATSLGICMLMRRLGAPWKYRSSKQGKDVVWINFGQCLPTEDSFILSHRLIMYGNVPEERIEPRQVSTRDQDREVHMGVCILVNELRACVAFMARRSARLVVPGFLFLAPFLGLASLSSAVARSRTPQRAAYQGALQAHTLSMTLCRK
ncbi:hypothetical protein F4824DRAFT_214811 [Ustulina deusta]|nr:hypothetical protein F4824DRAFT_214811 [Ustulina deusta]